ncbi:hypothetical protein PENTCL1PPCAC_27502, partial [Pristionchus entomophagus]
QLFHPFSLSCSHLFCSGCWLSHISHSIHRQRIPDDCLEVNCTQRVSISAARGILNNSSLLRYEKAMMIYLRSEGRLLSCPQCKRFSCSTGLSHLEPSPVLVGCTRCSLAEHFPVNCEIFRQ